MLRERIGLAIAAVVLFMSLGLYFAHQLVGAAGRIAEPKAGIEISLGALRAGNTGSSGWFE